MVALWPTAGLQPTPGRRVAVAAGHWETAMAHLRLNADDEGFLALPKEAALIFAGASGTETWIERESDRVVRIGIMAVATATEAEATLAVSIEIGGQTATGQDGPAMIETQLRASQAVQVLVKAGERLAFKAYPTANGAQVLLTVVWAGDLPGKPEATGPAQANGDGRQAEAPEMAR
jgi:hypothetical protein